MTNEVLPDTQRRRDTAGSFAFASSEMEVFRFLDGAAREYEEAMSLADFCDTVEPPSPSPVTYAWDNPIGLVICKRPLDHLEVTSRLSSGRGARPEDPNGST